jgi:hypothetical protein
MFEVGFGDATRPAGRSTTHLRLLIFSFAAVIALVISASLGATSANAAFTVTGFNTTPTSLQAGAHPNLTIHASADAVAGDKNGDDLKSLQVDLPAGLLVNPQSVATPCTATQLSSDTCPAATQVGTVTVQYRIAGTTATSNGSVYSITPDSSSVMNFGFVVRPNSYQKFFFSSSKVSGLATVRSGLDADYGLSILIPAIPNAVRSNIGLSLPMTISDLSITLAARSGAAQTGPYFVFNPTRCTPALTRATLTSNLAVVSTQTSVFTPTGCASVPFSPTFKIAPNNPNAGEASGVSATVTMPTADQAIQNADVRSAVVTLPPGTLLNLATVNSVPAVCTDAQLGADACPAGSQIGTASVNVPLLPSAMTGSIYLTSSSKGFTFGYVLHGVRGTIAILRGTAYPVDNGGASIQAKFDLLPQVPWSSATLNFTSNLTTNATTGCGLSSKVAWGDLTGYTDAESIIGNFYTLKNCPPPDTTVSGPTGTISNSTPSITFASVPATGATFECRFDTAAFTACTSPFTAPSLTDGAHEFDVRAVGEGGPDPTPAASSFTVDTTPPALDVTSPTEGGVYANDPLEVDFTSEAGATTYCRLDSTGLKPCASGQTYSGLTPGAHLVLVAAFDAVHNLSVVVRHFTVPAKPVVTITAPASGTTLYADFTTAAFTATSPVGSPITTDCDLIDLTDGNSSNGDPICTSPTAYAHLAPHHDFKLVVTATDDAGNVGTASTTFTSNIPLPRGPSALGGPGNFATTDRTPTFPLHLLGGPDTLHPTAVWECAIAPAGTTDPAYQPCGAQPSSSYTSPTDLPNGNWALYTRASTSDQVGNVGITPFSVTDWAPTYTTSTSTQQASAHPSFDIDITPNAGQLRSVDILLPKGLIGSLNSFDECPLDKVATAFDCPPSSQIGTVATRISITGVTVPALGEVYLTEPQQPGDAAGLTIYVHTALSHIYENVVIPLRLQLVDNSQYLRTFSDSIPISTPYHAGGIVYDANFYVNDFAMHLTGEAGSPFPLLTNPSSCAAGNWQVDLGDTEDNHVAATAPYQATGCETVPFAPTFTQTFSNPTAGQETGVHATITVPDGNSTLDAIHVAEPPLLAPSYPSFGQPVDRCHSLRADGTFDSNTCPPQSLVGSMIVYSPLLVDPLIGQVYLINDSPLPELGVALDDPNIGISIRLVGYISTQQVDPTCNPQKKLCPTQLAVDFGGIPDLPVSSIDFDLSGPPRVGANGTVLSGNIVLLSPKGNASCLPSVSTSASIKPQSSVTPAVINVSQPISGC